MPVDAQGRWHPDLYPKQKQAVDFCATPTARNLILLNGPRLSGKTWSCHHAVAQHAWNTDRGNICILTLTMSVGVDSGVWQHLTEIFLPEWIEADFGMKWVRAPYTQNVTKKPACEVSNVYGNKTRITLESLRNEDEVEERFKGKSYSMIWINELSKFKKRKTFDTLKLQLRMPHLKQEQHLFLADTNPDLELGAASWIYNLWYETRTADLDKLQALFPDTNPSDLLPLQRALHLIEFTVDDNLSLTPDRKAALRADFAHDPDLYAAYYEGKWVTASTDALFYKVFRPAYHCVPQIEIASDPEPETMVPEENCFELIGGFDPGAVNCAAAIMEKTFRKEGDKEISVIKVLDELVVVGQDFDLNDYVEDLVGQTALWENIIKSQAEGTGKVLWRWWSDRSAFDMKVPFSDRYWHQHIYTASGGRISLMAAERGKGSLKARIDLFRKLLFEDRIFFSRVRCPNAIQMVKSIRRDRNSPEKIAKGSVFKHIFDAITYGIASELFDELNREMLLKMRNLRRTERPENEPSLVSLSI